MSSNNVYEAIDPISRKSLYEFREDSNCYERECCFSCRGFIMSIRSREGCKLVVDMKGEKGCAVPCCCGIGCSKPSIVVDVHSPSGFKLGTVKLNYESFCCAPFTNRIDISENTQIPKYQLKRTCCCIACYTGCWAKCCNCKYTIFEENLEVGEVNKLSCSSCFTFCPKSDNYSIVFPTTATPSQKMLIITSAILLDYLTFYI